MKTHRIAAIPGDGIAIKMVPDHEGKVGAAVCRALDEQRAQA